MDEKRNCGSSAVRGYLGGGSDAANGWSKPALWPLLTDPGRVSFSKGFSKDLPALRFWTTRGAVLDRCLTSIVAAGDNRRGTP